MMRLGEKGWWTRAGLCLLVGACFSGEFVQGLPCHSDEDCYIQASNTGEFDNLGSSVAVSADGTTLAVQASEEDSSATGLNGNQDDNSTHDAGAVCLFKRTDNTWEQTSYIKAPRSNGNDNFGDVALSADASTLAVGTPGENFAVTGVGNTPEMKAAFDSGAVFLY